MEEFRPCYLNLIAVTAFLPYNYISKIENSGQKTITESRTGGTKEAGLLLFPEVGVITNLK